MIKYGIMKKFVIQILAILALPVCTLSGSIAIGEDTTIMLIEGLQFDGEIFTYVEGCDVAATVE